MIESIRIANIATYSNSPEILSGLSTFNFFFGSNGSGKTTITRVIANEGSFPTCCVTWKGGTKLQAMVYNRDFVEHNFNQSNELKGIFTLGEKSIETHSKIATAKSDLDILTKKIESLNINLAGENGQGGKRGELATLDEEFKNKCWSAYTKHKAKLASAFDGFRNSKENFKDKILKERTTNSATLCDLTDIEQRAQTVFGPTPIIEQSIPSLEAEKVVAFESSPILKKRVIGKEDVDIAAMIKKLGNSDWVREGRSFYEANETSCPFCQQSTTEAFAKSLDEYFDENFEMDSKSINDLVTNYTIASERLKNQIASVIATPSKYLDVEKLKVEKELLDSMVTINLQRLARKKKEPSQIVELESISNVASTITTLIDNANVSISGHNRMVKNLAQEQHNLKAQVWKYLLEVEIRADLTAYDAKRDALNKAIEGITTKLDSVTSDRRKKITEIQILEKEITSIQPTIDGINALLSSFGFYGFSLAKADNDTCYKLIRSDGTDAKETLSEGEKTFITFLYFFHLLKGSNSEAGITTDRIVVFDDPVSSLDSDILFIVGSLIKGLFDEVRTGASHIKQVFVLTHNVYFHKEVTFNPKRRNNETMSGEETFWIVRKSGLESKLEK